ncbi:MAG: transposase, partial [Candidatus Aminicenantia bacterium]
MARPLRIEYEGAFYHITARGNEKRVIFHDREDREKFFSYLEETESRYGSLIHMYCLMDNHYHLLIETPLGNISRVMQYINSSYTTYFNSKYRRIGHLFQGRYKSILVEKDAYASELSRYIHLNPVRGGLVERPEDYKWSSYRYYIGRGKQPKFLKVEMILSDFGRDKRKAKRRYKEYVEEGLKRQIENPLREVVASTVLGGKDFLKWVKERFIETREEARDLPAVRELKGEIGIDVIRGKVEEILGQTSESRKIGIYLSRKLGGRTLKEIAEEYGGISESGVSQIYRRMEQERKKNRNVDRKIKA